MTTDAPGIDLSFAAVSPTWCRRRYGEGHRVAVQCLWTGAAAPNTARANLTALRDGGLTLAGYLVPTEARTPAATIEAARTAAGPLWRHLTAVAVDAEEDPHTGEPLATYANVAATVAALIAAGLTPCVYSRRSYWLRHYGDADATVPTWTAERNTGPAIATIRYPWGRQPVIGKQYTGTTTVDGAAVDLNTFDLTFLRKENTMAAITERLTAAEAHLAAVDKRRAYEVHTAKLAAQAIALNEHGRPASARTAIAALLSAAGTLDRLIANGTVRP